MPTTYANSINNNPIYADRAEKDAAGNTISTTYATTADLANYQPTSSMSGYATTGDLSAYLPTSSIGVDTASAITSIAGSSIAGGGGGVVNLYGATGSSGYQTVRIGGSDTSDLGNTAATGAGLFLNNPTYGTAFYKVNELVLNRGGTARIDFNLSTGGSKVNITSTKGGYVTVSSTGSSSSASISMSATTSRATLKFSDRYATGQIYSTSIGYWNDKLDASASSSFITSTAGLATTADLSAYLPTSSIGVDSASAITSIGGSSIAGGTVTDVEVNGSSVVSGGVASITIPSQEQADWTESDTADPAYIQNKPDLVDIVAGPGIVVDNPDGNTLRVSMAADYETVLCDTVSNSSCTLSEAYTNFERIRIEWQYGSTITDTEYSIVPMLSEYYTDAITATTNKNVLMSVTNLNGNGSNAGQFVTRAALWKFNGTTTFEFVKGYQLFNGNITASTAIHIRRIVGIHRIANN